MKLFEMPSIVEGILFDIDNTLYEHKEYVDHQIEVLLRRLAEELRRPYEEVAREVEEWRKEAAKEEGGRRPSLGNSFLRFYDIAIETSVAWREELIEPEAFLSADPELRERLDGLSRRVAMCAVTNNPLRIGERTLHALGVGDLLPVVSGLDTSHLSKPNPRPFEVALEYLALPPGEILAVGDRYEIDLEPVIDLGGGGVLVEGREDLLLFIDRFLQGSLQ